MLADITTPVELYLRLRDVFPNTLLLECSDYHAKENHSSILCVDPLAEIIVDGQYAKNRYPDQSEEKVRLEKGINAYKLLENFIGKFQSEQNTLPYSGIYGYCAYESIPEFEDIHFKASTPKEAQVPKLRFGFFKNLIVFDHFHNKLTIIAHTFSDQQDPQMDELIHLIYNKRGKTFPFQRTGESSSNLTDEEYKNLVSKGIKACALGEVFQIVLSRKYAQKFKGDEFNVYRALRSVNPSPYLFYFDYTDYKIFGSSPESQLIIKGDKAYIYPIAGTVPRSGNDEKDKVSAELLAKDPKENSEHVMLVDLARNDLSRNSTEVKVEHYKEIQYFSHVLHMVSKVSGKLQKNDSSIKIFGESFPAGTLSGAPKYRAMELIDSLENQSRGIYGGALGFFGLNGQAVTAIIIRSFLSKNNTLFLQAGAGVVVDSKEENELDEVNSKLKALKKAIILAENI
ncbi:anthranilate synthase component I family protein [Bacteroidetes bacterium endosymbiont of Geopemphigus sp.]|uniref:anthranilate synthase component I family protein n=1 Tax=Bacteroidetes bacterium endosymbiont of Geopemphigus sp. TaxID=2047937 RepID=UPI001F4EC1A9|nr:anthranilate synthase component I family protein [Bacteroidetes bacterium endosymbiont of Geopemphigus sp.]